MPIDFSERSIGAIQPAKNLARRFNADVHLVHVHWMDYPAGFTAVPIPMPGWSMTVQKQVEASLAVRLSEIGSKFGLRPSNCHLLSGAPAFDEISRFARELPADLIVTSTHGYGGLKHYFLGSTAERVVQHAPCPVFVSRKGRATIDKILVPVDFSRCSLEGLKYAIQFADQFAARLFILNVVYLGEPYTADGLAMYDLSALEKEERKIADQEMQRFLRQLKFGNVKFETAIKLGRRVDRTTAFAKEKGIDLIITSTHGWSGFKHVLMGSTAEQVARRAACSVLVVPSHPEVRGGNLGDSSRAGRAMQQPKPARIPSAELSKRAVKLTRHPFPERRKTNKFRESELVRDLRSADR